MYTHKNGDMRDWKTIYNDNTNCSANRSASLSPFALPSFFHSVATLFSPLCAPFPIHFECYFSDYREFSKISFRFSLGSCDMDETLYVKVW